MRLILIILLLLTACQPRYQTSVDIKEYSKERGRDLILLAGCQRCHGKDLGGNTAGNISASDSGVGSYSLRDIVNLLRNPSNEQHKNYRWVSDYDAFSIAAYLKTSKPVDNGYAKEFAVTTDYGLGFVPEIRAVNKLEYGKYLVKNIAACDSCHKQEGGWFSEPVSFAEGEIEIDGEEIIVPALRSISWTDKDYLNLFQNGKTKNRQKLDNCTADKIRGNSEDLIAMSKYLQTLK